MASKEQKAAKKLERLSKFDGVDLCACNGLRCDSVCRDNHMRDGEVRCISLYQINISSIKAAVENENKASDIKTKTNKEIAREKFNSKIKRNIY